MNLSAWKDRLAAGKYDAPLAALYGAADAPRSRYARLCEEYLRTFGDAPDALLISAPGRTELAGNHTDHQLGIVLCAAVTLDRRCRRERGGQRRGDHLRRLRPGARIAR